MSFHKSQREKRKKSKCPTIFFISFYFFKNNCEVWSGNNKVPHIWTKIGHLFCYRSVKICSTPGWKGFGKAQFFIPKRKHTHMRAKRKASHRTSSFGLVKWDLP